MEYDFKPLEIFVPDPDYLLSGECYWFVLRPGCIENLPSPLVQNLPQPMLYVTISRCNIRFFSNIHSAKKQTWKGEFLWILIGFKCNTHSGRTDAPYFWPEYFKGRGFFALTVNQKLCKKSRRSIWLPWRPGNFSGGIWKIWGGRIQSLCWEYLYKNNRFLAKRGVLCPYHPMAVVLPERWGNPSADHTW